MKRKILKPVFELVILVIIDLPWWMYFNVRCPDANTLQLIAYSISCATMSWAFVLILAWLIRKVEGNE